MEYDISSARPIVRIEVDLLDDGEPPFVLHLVDPRSDGRYSRGLRWKPTVNGTYALMVTGYDDQGCSGHSFGSQSVTVVF